MCGYDVSSAAAETEHLALHYQEYAFRFESDFSHYPCPDQLEFERRRSPSTLAWSEIAILHRRYSDASHKCLDLHPALTAKALKRFRSEAGSKAKRCIHLTVRSDPESGMEGSSLHPTYAKLAYTQ